jgi:hypothetical protein
VHYYLVGLFQGGLGGALDVVGQALTKKTSPDVQQAVQRIAQSEQAQN